MNRSFHFSWWSSTEELPKMVIQTKIDFDSSHKQGLITWKRKKKKYYCWTEHQHKDMSDLKSCTALENHKLVGSSTQVCLITWQSNCILKGNGLACAYLNSVGTILTIPCCQRLNWLEFPQFRRKTSFGCSSLHPISKVGSFSIGGKAKPGC